MMKNGNIHVLTVESLIQYMADLEACSGYINDSFKASLTCLNTITQSKLLAGAVSDSIDQSIKSISAIKSTFDNGAVQVMDFLKKRVLERNKSIDAEMASTTDALLAEFGLVAKSTSDSSSTSDVTTGGYKYNQDVPSIAPQNAVDPQDEVPGTQVFYQHQWEDGNWSKFYTAENYAGETIQSESMPLPLKDFNANNTLVSNLNK